MRVDTVSLMASRSPLPVRAARFRAARPCRVDASVVRPPRGACAWSATRRPRPPPQPWRYGTRGGGGEFPVAGMEKPKSQNVRLAHVNRPHGAPLGTLAVEKRETLSNYHPRRSIYSVAQLAHLSSGKRIKSRKDVGSCIVGI